MLSSVAAVSGGKMTAADVERYLAEAVFPVLTDALADMCLLQPADPFQWLAGHLPKLSPKVMSAPAAGPVDTLTASGAATMNQLQEVQPQLDGSLIATRASQQVVFDLEIKLNQIQSQAVLKDRQIQVLEQRCATSEKAADTAMLKLKVAADECERLEREVENIQQKSAAMKLVAQTALADEATAKWREADSALQQCRHAMQRDADRLQVFCGGASALDMPQ